MRGCTGVPVREVDKKVVVVVVIYLHSTAPVTV